MKQKNIIIEGWNSVNKKWGKIAEISRKDLAKMRSLKNETRTNFLV